MKRRTLLKGLAIGGTGLVVTGTAALGWRAQTAGLLSPDEAPFAPWSALAHTRPGDPVGLAAAAILASNPHNTQPWRIAISPDMFRLKADPARNLGAFDPFRREMWIGLGAGVANAEVIAPGLGFRTGEPAPADLAPDGAGAIRMALAPARTAPHPLAPGIAVRRTNRAPYRAEPIAPAALNAIVAAAGDVSGAQLILLSRSEARGAAFADGTLAATRAIVADKAMSADGHAWYRANAREVALHRDGVSIPTAGLSPTIAALGQILPESDAETSGRYWLSSTEGQVTGAAGFGLILVDDLDDRGAQVAAGRLWQRLHLALTLAGLAAQPLNQLPEMVDRDRQLQRAPGWAARLAAIAGPGGHATFAFRFGRPLRQVPQSARRPLQWVAG